MEEEWRGQRVGEVGKYGGSECGNKRDVWTDGSRKKVDGKGMKGEGWSGREEDTDGVRSDGRRKEYMRVGFTEGGREGVRKVVGGREGREKYETWS